MPIQSKQAFWWHLIQQYLPARKDNKGNKPLGGMTALHAARSEHGFRFGVYPKESL